MNLKPRSSPIFSLFYFLFLYLCQFVLFNKLLLLIYAQENTNQFYNLKNCVVVVFILFEKENCYCWYHWLFLSQYNTMLLKSSFKSEFNCFRCWYPTNHNYRHNQNLHKYTQMFHHQLIMIHIFYISQFVISWDFQSLRLS